MRCGTGRGPRHSGSWLHGRRHNCRVVGCLVHVINGSRVWRSGDGGQCLRHPAIHWSDRRSFRRHGCSGSRWRCWHWCRHRSWRWSFSSTLSPTDAGGRAGRPVGAPAVQSRAAQRFRRAARRAGAVQRAHRGGGAVPGERGRAHLHHIKQLAAIQQHDRQPHRAGLRPGVVRGRRDQWRHGIRAPAAPAGRVVAVAWVPLRPLHVVVARDHQPRGTVPAGDIKHLRRRLHFGRWDGGCRAGRRPCGRDATAHHEGDAGCGICQEVADDCGKPRRGQGQWSGRPHPNARLAGEMVWRDGRDRDPHGQARAGHLRGRDVGAGPVP
mmetsp:Transcript_8383/g.25319  ORF Transcript_8383/g.25319 Transcript_8383/m.25319 type:complete len:324 (-) Transcript_8383:486-1457(-)